MVVSSDYLMVGCLAAWMVRCLVGNLADLLVLWTADCLDYYLVVHRVGKMVGTKADSKGLNLVVTMVGSLDEMSVEMWADLMAD